MTEPTPGTTPATPGAPVDEAARAIEQATPVEPRVEGDWVDEMDESTDPPTKTGRKINRWTGEAQEAAPEFGGQTEAPDAPAATDESTAETADPTSDLLP